VADKKIKVIQVIHGMHYGGAENVVYNIVNQLEETEFDSFICCTNFTGDIGEEMARDGFPIRTLPKGLGVIGTYKAIRSLLDELDADVVHTHGTPALLAVSLLFLRRRKTKWIHTYHFGNYPHVKKTYLYAEKALSRFADQLVSVSDSQQRAVIRHLGVAKKKIMTIFNGVPDNPCRNDAAMRASYRNALGYTDQDIVVASIVVLTRQKGINYLIDSVDSVCNQQSNVKYLIVGGGVLENDLREQAAQVKHSDKIQFTGWRKDIKEIMTAVDVFVLPSLWEGLPMVLLEAMASGLPVIVTDVADNANVVEDGRSGYVIPPADTEALQDAILKMTSDGRKVESFGEQARISYEQRFTVSKMVEQYAEVYRRLSNS
jgi:glycosyltransferase involved in cell wall biosynthesis